MAGSSQPLAGDCCDCNRQQATLSIRGNLEGLTLTLVTATLAPLLISCTTLSACPLCEAMRRCSERARTSAASSWLMEQSRRRCSSQTKTTGSAEGSRWDQPLASRSYCWKQRHHLSSTMTPLHQQLEREETQREDGTTGRRERLEHDLQKAEADS